MAGVRTKRLRWSMFWAVVSYFITILGTQLTNYLTTLDVSPFQGALISTGVGLGVVLIGVVIDHARDGEGVPAAAEASRTYGGPPPGYPAQPSRPVARTGRTSLAAALVIILLVCGAGGLGVTFAAQWIAARAAASFDEITGKSKANPGVERLAAPASKTSGMLTITVNSVQVNERATVIDLTARNEGGESLTLTRGFCQLMVPGEATLETDKFVGTWGDGTVAAGGERNGTIIFNGRLGQGTKNATLAFTTIFGSGFGGPRDIAVEIALT